MQINPNGLPGNPTPAPASAPTLPTPLITNTQPILKFISKKSKKDVICNIESVNTTSEPADVQVIQVTKPAVLKSPTSEAKLTSSIYSPHTPAPIASVLANASPKISKTASNTAEKRSRHFVRFFVEF
jgi:hypothetical protein